MDSSNLEVVLDVNSMNRDINRVLKETISRGLLNTTKWLAEINFALKN